MATTAKKTAETTLPALPQRGMRTQPIFGKEERSLLATFAADPEKGRRLGVIRRGSYLHIDPPDGFATAGSSVHNAYYKVVSQRGADDGRTVSEMVNMRNGLTVEISKATAIKLVIAFQAANKPLGTVSNTELAAALRIVAGDYRNDRMGRASKTNGRHWSIAEPVSKPLALPKPGKPAPSSPPIVSNRVDDLSGEDTPAHQPAA